MCKKFFPPILFLAVFLLTISPSFAAVTITASPVDGSNSLRFGREDISSSATKEIRFRVNSSLAKQYQVFQRLENPLVNERGEGIEANVLRYSATIGSNSGGTLYGQGLDVVSRSDQIIYTSNENGDSDAFTLLYSIDPARMTATGLFQGRLVLTVRALDGGATQNVYFDVSIDAVGNYRLEITGEQGQNLIRLTTDNLSGDPAATVRVVWSGYMGQSLKIYQEIASPPRTTTGEEVDLAGLSVAGEDAQGKSALAEIPLSLRREELYQTNFAEGQLTLVYRFSRADLAGIKAGDYVGQLRYVVDNGREEQVFLLDFAVSVTPVLELSLEFPEGNVHFAHLLPQTPPQLRQVKVAVKSNTGKPYVVTQEIKSTLTNPAGDQWDPSYFAWRSELADGAVGRVAQPDFVPVSLAATPIFFSGREGAPADFQVIYRMTPYQGMPSGEFSTAVVYSLSEM